MFVVTVTSTNGTDFVFVIREDVPAYIAQQHAVDTYDRMRLKNEELEPIDWAVGVKVQRALVV